MNRTDILQNRLYDDLVDLWPLVTPHSDYAEEAIDYRKALRNYLGGGRLRILDLGTGGGHLLHYVAEGHEAEAVDISECMLEYAERLNPDVIHHHGDMRKIRLNRTFDAVVIHDAIDYMLTKEDLASVFATAKAHLKSGGILITAPDNYRDTFEGPKIEHITNSGNGVDLTLVEYVYDPDPSDTTIETILTYYIRSDEGLRIELDRHITGLFPHLEWVQMLKKAGFTVEEWLCSHGDAAGRNLLVGILQ